MLVRKSQFDPEKEQRNKAHKGNHPLCCQVGIGIPQDPKHDQDEGGDDVRAQAAAAIFPCPDFSSIAVNAMLSKDVHSAPFRYIPAAGLRTCFANVRLCEKPAFGYIRL